MSIIRSPIEQVFCNGYSCGFKTRGCGYNGLIEWKNLCATYSSEVLDTPVEWTDEVKTFYDIFRDLDVTGDDSDLGSDHNHPDHKKWENHHFLIQAGGRIVKNNPNGTMRRLLQIAYNIGQYNAQAPIYGSYTDVQMGMFQILNMNRLETYIKM